MKYTATELMRVIGYGATALAGLFCIYWGATHDNPELIASGSVMLGAGAVAGAKTNKTKAPPINFDPEEMPRPGEAEPDVETPDFDADPIDEGYRDLDDDEDPKHGA